MLLTSWILVMYARMVLPLQLLKCGLITTTSYIKKANVWYANVISF